MGTLGLNQFQILQPVVQSISVSVMNNLGRQQPAPKCLFHDQPMLSYRSTFSSSHDSVAIAINRSALKSWATRSSPPRYSALNRASLSGAMGVEKETSADFTDKLHLPILQQDSHVEPIL
jgi:hypothetical protein